MASSGGYNGSNFLLVYDVVKQLIASGRSDLISDISDAHKTSVKTEEVIRNLKEHCNF